LNQDSFSSSDVPHEATQINPTTIDKILKYQGRERSKTTKLSSELLDFGGSGLRKNPRIGIIISRIGMMRRNI
jgi:hypothetical protein